MHYKGYGLDLDWSDSLTGFEWSWTLDGAGSVGVHVGGCLLYCMSVFGLQAIMSRMSETDKKAMRTNWHFDTIKYLHNIALSAVSLGMGVVMIYVIISDGRFSAWKNMACQNTPNKGAYGVANMVYLLTKIWEWADTFWLILYSKPVIPLHFFHHMTTFTMAALTHNFPVGGFAFINCFVHFVMYLHYSHPVRWARPFITTSQLVQFVCVLSVHAYGYLNSGTECFDFSKVTREWWYCLLVVVGYFVLFVKFFMDNYVTKWEGKKKGKGKGKSPPVPRRTKKRR